MNETVQQKTYSATLVAAAMERLFEPRRGGGFAPRPRFAAFVLLCLLLHVIILTILLWEDRLASLRVLPPVEEIPVEVITEPPPAPKQEQPPSEPEAPQPKPEQQKPPPPPPTPTVDEKPAFDAPKAESKSKSERDAPEEKEQKAPRIAPPTDKVAPKDEKPQGLRDAQDEDEGAKTPDSAPEKQIEEKQDAEIIERAEPKEKPQDKPEPKEHKPAKKGEAKSIADQVAALAPLPDFQLGAPPKASPVGGGQAKTTYLTILYGLIMPHMHIPPRVRGSQLVTKGVVAFYIDEMGNLTHQAVYRSSGAPDLDAAALMAVRRAAPFPPPPRGLPHSMLFTYATK